MALLIDLRASHLNVMILGAATPYLDPQQGPEHDQLFIQAWLPALAHRQVTHMGLTSPRDAIRHRVTPSDRRHLRHYDQFKVPLTEARDMEFNTLYCPREGRPYQVRCQLDVALFGTVGAQVTFYMSSRRETLLHVRARLTFMDWSWTVEVVRNGDLPIRPVPVAFARGLLGSVPEDEPVTATPIETPTRTPRKFTEFLKGQLPPKPVPPPEEPQDIWSLLRSRRRSSV